MPRKSQRQTIIKHLALQSLMELIQQRIDDRSCLLEDMIQEMPELKALFVVLSQRYLTDRSSSVPRAPSRFEWCLKDLDEVRFKQTFRMNQESFYRLYDLIKDHEVYLPTGGRPQKDVRLQMMVALERLGMYGNGASVGRVARSAGISGMLKL